MPSYKGLAGNTYGKLTVMRDFMEFSSKSGRNFHKCECKCECGKVVTVFAQGLIKGSTTSCGCLTLIKRSANRENKVKLLKGNKYNRLLVLYDYRDEGKKKGKQHYCHCLCDCGKTTEVYAGNLTGNQVKSCGCLNIEMAVTTNYSHGFSSKSSSVEMKKFYNIWHGMKHRCTNPNDHRYKTYSIYGICTEWRNSFVCFKNDMWESFIAHYKLHGNDTEIDRIDNNKGYYPENCRWATRKEQTNNTSRNHFISYNGIRHTISEWSLIMNLSPKLVHLRIKRGWSVERALETPPLRPSTKVSQGIR